jgi:hypothetical protein
MTANDVRIAVARTIGRGDAVIELLRVPSLDEIGDLDPHRLGGGCTSFASGQSLLDVALSSEHEITHAAPTTDRDLHALRMSTRSTHEFKFDEGAARFRPPAGEWRDLPVGQSSRHPLDPLWSLAVLTHAPVQAVKAVSPICDGDGIRAAVEVTADVRNGRGAHFDRPHGGPLGVWRAVTGEWRRFPLHVEIGTNGSLAACAYPMAAARRRGAGPWYIVVFGKGWRD